ARVGNATGEALRSMAMGRGSRPRDLHADRSSRLRHQTQSRPVDRVRGFSSEVGTVQLLDSANEGDSDNGAFAGRPGISRDDVGGGHSFHLGGRGPDVAAIALSGVAARMGHPVLRAGAESVVLRSTERNAG